MGGSNTGWDEGWFDKSRAMGERDDVVTAGGGDSKKDDGKEGETDIEQNKAGGEESWKKP